MRNKFRGYIPYTKEEKETIWENDPIFIFDTNFLLGLYRYTKETQNKFLNILDKIKDQIWIPHQVGKEYFNRRCDVLSKQHKIYDDLKKVAEFNDMKSLCHQLKNRHTYLDSDKILEIIEKAQNEITKYIVEIESKDSDIPYNNDNICKKIVELFDNKIGEKYSDKELEALYNKGANRFAKKIPPGYMDSKKNDVKKYGDYIIWEQIIFYIGKNKKTNIIFVTADKKDDWWQKINGKTIGPRPELIEEIWERTKANCLIYDTAQFLKIASPKYNNDTNANIESSLEEVKSFYDLEYNTNNNIFINDNFIDNYIGRPQIRYFKKKHYHMLMDEYNHNKKLLNRRINEIEDLKEQQENLISKYKGQEILAEKDYLKNEINRLKNQIDTIIFKNRRIVFKINQVNRYNHMKGFSILSDIDEFGDLEDED